MTKQDPIRHAARLWLNPAERDVAEIRLDDLLNPTGDHAIESIEEGLLATVIVTFENGDQRWITTE